MFLTLNIDDDKTCVCYICRKSIKKNQKYYHHNQIDLCKGCGDDLIHMAKVLGKEKYTEYIKQLEFKLANRK